MPRSVLWCTGIALAVAGVVTAYRRSSAERTSPLASATAPAATPDAPEPAGARHPVSVSFHNVRLHVTDTVVLEIRRLNGALISNQPGRPPIFDDQRSFTLRIDSGEIALSTTSLAHLLNDYVFAYKGAPLSDLEISVEGGALKQKGKLHKGVVVPFTVVADVGLTTDGKIRLRPTSVKAAGVPSGGLMKLLGIELDDLIKTNKTPAIRVVENDLVITPDQLLPEPRIEGRLTAVRVEGDRLIQQFGPPTAATGADGRAANYMYYRGGTLKFGKLTMSDADMELIDADPTDPFDFFPARYLDQLTAGYSKNLRNGGLKVYMPDYDDSRRADLRPR
jgi:hypothetical protein